jgi:hypothetical protein
MINLVRPAGIKKKGAAEAEAVSRMVDYVDMKDVAVQRPYDGGCVLSLYQALDIISYSV